MDLTFNSRNVFRPRAPPTSCTPTFSPSMDWVLVSLSLGLGTLMISRVSNSHASYLVRHGPYGLRKSSPVADSQARPQLVSGLEMPCVHTC